MLKVLICILFLWLARKLQIAYLTPLGRIPSAHSIAPFSRAWILWTKWMACENHARYAAHQRLGPVIRIGPHELSVNCIDDGVRTIYGPEYEKDAWYTRAFRGDE